MHYRREIDGLRALAVIPVILFHAGFPGFSGGFVGVDIFFVISGYLVTSILLAEMENGRFSVVAFYERRARRILPALFFVMAACLPFAWLWLVPAEMADFGKSLIAVVLYGSNILFWRQSGYFEADAELKPLLHTWSLSVEEQFYIILPLFLLLTLRLGRQRIFWSLLGGSIASLVAAQILSGHKPSANFFLLPTRCWELLAGSLVALYLGRPQSGNEPRWLREAAGILGLVLIIYSVTAYSEATPFPSLYSLAPVIGTALVILYVAPETLAGRLLCLPVFVGIGLVSYSAYLWHQPIFAFARHAAAEEPGLMSFALLSTFSLGLAYLSWRFVEHPFRDKQRFSRGAIFRICAAGTLFFMAAGFAAIKVDGLVQRFPAELARPVDFAWMKHVRADSCMLQEPDSNRRAESCAPHTNLTIALWGDSHAASLYPGLAELMGPRPEWGVNQLTQAGCPPLLAISNLIYKKNCNELNQTILSDLKAAPPTVLIMHAAWIHPHYPLSLEALEEKLRLTLDRVRRDLPDTKVVLIGPVPRWGKSAQLDTLVHFNHTGEVGRRDGELSFLRAVLLRDVDQRLATIAQEAGITYISPISQLCQGDECVSRVGPAPEDWMSADYGHLTRAGSIYLVRKIQSALLPDTH